MSRSSSSSITSVAIPRANHCPSLIENAFCERAHTAPWSKCGSHHRRLQWPSAPAGGHGRPRRTARLAEPGRGGSGHSKELRRIAARRRHCSRLMHAGECWHPKRLVSGPFHFSMSSCGARLDIDDALGTTSQPRSARSTSQPSSACGSSRRLTRPSRPRAITLTTTLPCI